MFLKNIGVLGFDPLEKVILAALVTEEPILIIGRPGTDKANLLVYISQALGLSFKKVNAAMTSKLELTGMPVVKDNDDKITFISAPDSVWKKQALVFDLLNEAKPICMSVISSILFEKQINGYPMETLQYRWATMENTDLFNSDMTAFKRRNIYLEEELVENFAFIIEAPTWDNFSVEEKLEGFISGFTHPVKELNNELIAFISKLKPLYEEQLLFPKPKLAAYACLVTSLLNEGGVYVSVQRSLQLLRNLVALDLVNEHWNEEENKDKMGDTLLLGLTNTLTQKAFHEKIPDRLIHAIHRNMMQQLFNEKQENDWIGIFMKAGLTEKMDMLFDNTVDEDLKSLAFIHFFNHSTITERAMLVFSAQPILHRFDILNEEAFNMLTKCFKEILHVDGEIKWLEFTGNMEKGNLVWSNCQVYLLTLPGGQTSKRYKRAYQFFIYLMTNDKLIIDPAFIEEALNDCFEKCQMILKFRKQEKLS
jgi:MoxR-like ATPase